MNHIIVKDEDMPPVLLDERGEMDYEYFNAKSVQVGNTGTRSKAEEQHRQQGERKEYLRRLRAEADRVDRYKKENPVKVAPYQVPKPGASSDCIPQKLPPHERPSKVPKVFIGEDDWRGSPLILHHIQKGMQVSVETFFSYEFFIEENTKYPLDHLEQNAGVIAKNIDGVYGKAVSNLNKIANQSADGDEVPKYDQARALRTTTKDEYMRVTMKKLTTFPTYSESDRRRVEDAERRQQTRMPTQMTSSEGFTSSEPRQMEEGEGPHTMSSSEGGTRYQRMSSSKRLLSNRERSLRRLKYYYFSSPIKRHQLLCELRDLFDTGSEDDLEKWFWKIREKSMELERRLAAGDTLIRPVHSHKLYQ